MSLYLISVTLHVLAALFWLGGMFFLAVVGAPVLRAVEPAGLRAELFRRLGARFRVAGWIAIAILLVTGIANLALRDLLRAEVLGSGDFWATPFGGWLAWKLGLVIAIVALAALHDFVLGPRASREAPGSPSAVAVRRRASWLARVNVALGVALVVVAVRLARGG